MSAEIRGEVKGLREALKVLGQLDKESRKEAIKQLKAGGSTMVAAAKLTYPDRPPLSGMKSKSGRLNYSPGRVRQGVTLRVGGRMPPQRDRYPVVTITQSSAAGQLYSMAGMRNNKFSRATNKGQEKFSQNLENRWGKPQRGMWKERRLISQLSEDFMEKAVENVIRDANRKLAN